MGLSGLEVGLESKGLAASALGAGERQLAKLKGKFDQCLTRVHSYYYWHFMYVIH